MSDTIEAPPEAAWVVQRQFQFLEPFLIGSPRQFSIWQGNVVCLRAHPDDPERRNPVFDPCTGCPHHGHGCALGGEIDMEATHRQPDNSISGIEPHSRRGVGLEERDFLVLRFLPGQSHATLPVHLWDSPWADLAMHESNLHHVLVNPRATLFHSFKGQVRYYGPEADFLVSEYAEHFEVVDVYQASHRPISLDFSAIEPRFSTIVSREPAWLRVFQGEPKIIFREVRFASGSENPPPYVHAHEGKLYCHLDDEMDKTSFTVQCAKCRLRDVCRTEVDHFHKVASDWHGLNTQALYGDEYRLNKDSFFKKELRAIGKIIGLALCLKHDTVVKVRLRQKGQIG